MTSETQTPMKPPETNPKLQKIKEWMITRFNDMEDRTRGDEMAAWTVWAVIFVMGLWFGALMINLIIQWTS